MATHMARHTLYMIVYGLSYSPWKWEALASALLVYAFALLWFFFNPPTRIMGLPERINLRKFSSFLIGGLLFACSVITFQYRELNLMDWYTPVLALTAFGMILLGLLWRDSVVRILGIIALLAPLLRLFVVDVQDALHRIIAFAAAAVVLTALGYLYHRLSERLKPH